MTKVPRAVESALLRGVGAYLRATPTQELRPPLRRFKGMRPHALGRFKEQLLGLLEDDAMRALILQWLDDKPAISKGDAVTLRLALERDDGWEDALVALSHETAEAVEESETDADATAVELQRATERTRRAKDDARRAREERDRTVSNATAEASRERERADATAAELRRREEELERLRTRLVSATRDIERQRRKIKKLQDDERAARERTKAAAKQQMKELRAELTELRRQLAARPQSPPSKDRTTKRAEPRPRQRLPVPKGRYEDDPLTLDAWLSTPNVHLLIDGYNVAKAEGGFGELELGDQRDRLIDGVARLARKKAVAATIVFDGSVIPPGVARRRRGPVDVQYSKPSEIADDHLVALLEALPPDPVIVATNDKELQERVAGLGATLAASAQLLALIR